MWSDMLKTKNSHVNQHHHSKSHAIKNPLTDVIYSNVRVLPWSSPLSCPCCRRCRRPPTLMCLMWSDILKTKKLSCQPTSSQHITSYNKRRQLMWYILMSVSSLVFSSKLSSLCTVWSTTNSRVFNVVRYFEKNPLMSTNIIKAHQLL